jgi:protein SCO1/2
MPQFELADHRGVPVRSAELRGRVVVLTFLDSQCTETCPILASVIARTIDRLKPSEREQVQAVAISTDPSEDTSASVSAFLRRHRAARQLRYLVGGESELRALWREFKILSSLESGKDTLHSAPVRIYSRGGIWVATQHAGVELTPQNLVSDIRVALAGGERRR